MTNGVELKIEHILIFIIVVFLLYYLINRCQCTNRVVNGFNVGAQPQHPSCSETLNNLCSPFENTEIHSASDCKMCAGLNQRSMMLAKCTNTDIDRLCIRIVQSPPLFFPQQIKIIFKEPGIQPILMQRYSASWTKNKKSFIKEISESYPNIWSKLYRTSESNPNKIIITITQSPLDSNKYIMGFSTTKITSGNNIVTILKDDLDQKYNTFMGYLDNSSTFVYFMNKLINNRFFTTQEFTIKLVK